MKILIIQPYFSFLDVIIDTFPSYLARRGHEVEVVGYTGDKKRKYSFLERENIRFHFINAFSISVPNLVTEFPYFLSFRNVIEKINPDIIHINNLPFLTTFQAVRIANRMAKRNIIQVHGVLGYRSLLLNLAQKAYLYTFGSYVFHKTDRIICLTTSDSGEIIKYGCPPEKIRIVPNGVDVNLFSPSGDEESDLVLWSGRFVQEKGLVYLIKALQITVQKIGCSKIRLIMTGEGPLLPKIIGLAKEYGLMKNILFRGRVPHREMPTLMNRSSIYVLPSLKEGMPYALLEAMACGKAVIGSNIPGIKDIITHGENGILVPPKNPEALATAILLLLEDKGLRRRLGQAARQLMIEKYSWEIISEKIERVYNEVVHTGP